MIVLFILAFVAAAAADMLAIEWHEARERSSVARAAAIAMLLEALGWLPLLLAIQTEDFTMMVAAIAGSGAGNVLGLRRARARKLQDRGPVA